MSNQLIYDQSSDNYCTKFYYMHPTLKTTIEAHMLIPEKPIIGIHAYVNLRPAGPDSN